MSLSFIANSYTEISSIEKLPLHKACTAYLSGNISNATSLHWADLKVYTIYDFQVSFGCWKSIVDFLRHNVSAHTKRKTNTLDVLLNIDLVLFLELRCLSSLSFVLLFPQS